MFAHCCSSLAPWDALLYLVLPTGILSQKSLAARSKKQSREFCYHGDIWIPSWHQSAGATSISWRLRCANLAQKRGDSPHWTKLCERTKSRGSPSRKWKPLCLDNDDTGNRYLHGFIKTSRRIRESALRKLTGPAITNTVTRVTNTLMDIQLKDSFVELGDRK